MKRRIRVVGVEQQIDVGDDHGRPAFACFSTKASTSKSSGSRLKPAGSIPARKDADLAKYDSYQKQAIADFASNKIAGSIVHGAAAKESFVSDYNNVIAEFVSTKDVSGGQAKLVAAAKVAGYK